MATNFHLGTVEESFEVSKKVEPVRVDLTAVQLNDKNTRSGLFKLSLSIAYFFALVIFLIKLLA